MVMVGCTVFRQQRGEAPHLTRGWAWWAKSGLAFWMRPCLGLKGCIAVRQVRGGRGYKWGKEGHLVKGEGKRKGKEGVC